MHLGVVIYISFKMKDNYLADLFFDINCKELCCVKKKKNVSHSICSDFAQTQKKKQFKAWQPPG